MKINYKNTALGLIDDPKNFYFGFPDGPNGGGMTPDTPPKKLLDFAHSLIDSSEKLKQLCGNNIQLVSYTFWEAYVKARPKIREIFDKEDIEEGGVLILPANGITHTYYYYVKTYKTSGGIWTYDCLFMDFNKRNTESHADGPALDVYTSCTLAGDGEHIDRKSLVWNGYINQGKDAKWWDALILTFVLFKKYCDIETKEVSPQNRRAKVGGQKYINETDKRIKILDCTWFTNLVVSGQFGVTGHLRWQPWGPNNSQRKLIWVADYVKEGYVRKAKMLNNEQENT